MQIQHDNKLKIIIFVVSIKNSNSMSNEQIKKDLLSQRGIIKLKIKQLTFIEEQTGIKKTKEINALLDCK